MAVDGAGDQVQVQDVRVVPRLRQLVHPDKIVCLTITEKVIETKKELRNFFCKKRKLEKFDGTTTDIKIFIAAYLLVPSA